MPNYLVELEDGRKLQVEADSQPTEQEVIAALGDSAPAEKQRPFVDITDTASSLVDFARGILPTSKSSYYQIKEGLDNPWKRSESYLAAGKATQEYQKELDAAEAAAVESGDTSSVSSAFRAAAPSSGFSVGAMGSALAGGSLLGTVGGRVGAAMGGPAGLAAGEIGGRAVGAFAGSYGAAYRAAGAQFLDDARDEINHIAETKFGRPLTEAEQEEAYQELLPLAQAFGNAEAGPEAIGNLAMGAAGRFVLGLGRETVKRLATSALAKAGAVAGGATVELGGETATQVEQKRVEEQKQALLEGRDPAAVAAAQPDRTVAEYATALEEVGPATLATLFLMGGAGKVASKVLDMSRPAPVSLTEEELRASVDLGYAKAKLDEEKANAAEDTGYQSSRAILKAQRVREGYEKVRQTLAEGDIEEAAKLMQAKIVEQSVLATAEEAAPTETANVEIPGAGTWNSDSGVPLEVAKGIIESKDTKGIQSLIDNGVLTPPQVIPKTAPPDAQAFAANAAKAAATGVPVNATVAALRDTSGVEDIGTTEGDVLSLVPKKPVVEEPVAPNEAEIEALVPELFDPALSTGSRSVTPEITEKKDAVARKLESLLGLPSGHLTPMRWNVSKVFKTADGRYLKVGAAADAESLQRLQDQLELAKESPHAVVPELRVLHSAGIYALTQSDAGIEGADLHKSATKEDKQLFELLKEQNPFSAETSNGALRVETDTSLKNMALYVGPDGMVRTRAFDFDGVPEDTSPADVAAAKEVLAKTPLMPGIPLAEFSPAIQNRLAPAEQPVAEEVADPFTPVVETTGKKDLQVEPDTRTEVGMPSTPPQRDTTKIEQQTPDEYIDAVNYDLALIRAEKDLSGKMLKALKKEGREAYRERSRRNLQPSHISSILANVGLDEETNAESAKYGLPPFREPVSAEAVDAYQITLPEGYVRQGDLYIFSPQTAQAAAETQTPAPSRKGGGAAGVVERQPTEGSIPVVESTVVQTPPVSNAEKAPEQMTPEEFAGNELASAKYVEEMGKLDAKGVSPPPREFMLKAATTVAHKEVIAAAIEARKPVSAEAVGAYGIKLPEGYVRQGDLYVFQPTSPTVETPTESLPADKKPMSGDSGTVRKPKKAPRKKAAPKPVTEQNRAPVQEEGVVVDEAPRPLPPTSDEVGAHMEMLLKAPSKTSGKPRVSFKTQTEESAFRMGFQAAVKAPGNPPPPDKAGLSPKDRKWDDAWRVGWSQGQTFMRSRQPSEEATSQPETPSPTPAPIKYKFKAGDYAAGMFNGVMVTGKVIRSTPTNTIIEYAPGKDFVTNNPVPAAQALATAPKYQYTQEQNTAKAARLGLPTTPGVTENAGEVIRNVLLNASKDTRLSPLTRAIARALRSVNFDGVRLRIKADGRSGAGLYTHENGVGEIMVNLRAVARGQVDSIGVFLHEALHHATLEKLFNPAPGIETEAVDAIKKIVDHVKTLAGPDTVFDYELGSPWEFVSALFTRPDFQNYLASVPAPGSPTGIAKFRSALSELFRRLAELVTGQKVQKGSTMEQAIAATMVLFETPQRTGDGAAGAMAGENAELPQFMRDSLETAKAMAAAGKSSEEIRAITGWFPGKYDGEMRWEIPDEGAMLRLGEFRQARIAGENPEEVVRKFFSERQARQQEEALASAKGMPKEQLLAFSRDFTARKKAENTSLYEFFVKGDNKDNGRIPLGYLLDHPALFEAYPELQWTPVSFNAEDVGFDVAGQANPDGSIGLNPAFAFSDEAAALSTLLHEAQHLIQKKEGFAKGSSTEQAARRQGWDDYYDKSQVIKDYERAAGEIEARDVQARQSFTPEQRKAVAPYSSENIAPEDAIVMFGGSGPQASISTMVLFETPQRTGDGAAGAMADRDAEYMAAVEAGDMETAQRMVDEAAKAAGYETKAWHGSPDDEFTVFQKPEKGADEEGFWFSKDREWASKFGPTRIFYIKNAKTWGGDDFVVKDPNSVKSADPVTRGADGNVIPLSQRFNETSNDIRYAASTNAPATSKLPPGKARAILTKRFGKAGGKFVVGAFDADGDIEWDAKIGDGNITLNLKYLDTEAKLIAKAEHELAHAVFDDPAVQQEWKAISRTLSPAAREKLAARLKGLGYADAVLDEEMLVQTLEEIRRNTPPAAWQRFVKAVRDALLRLFGMDVSQGDAERAAARIVAAGEAALAQGLDPAVAAFGQSAAESAASRRHAELEAKFNAGTITPEETAEAQALVDQAAKAAGYNITSWHGSNQPGAVFSYYLAGRGGYRFFANKEYAQTYAGKDGTMRRSFLMTLKPINLRSSSGRKDYSAEQAEDTLSSRGVDTSGITFKGSAPMWSQMQSEGVKDALQDAGYDSVAISETDGADVTRMVFDPHQIKSADPFTGVPLDRRFDAGSNDIRYSRVNPDAELNKQTNVQFGSEKQRNIRPAAPQQETANKASAIIGEAIAKDPVNGRMNALLRFDSDTKIPLEVRAIGAAMLAEQVEYLNVLSARAGNALPEATDLADDFVDRAISIVQRLGTELGRGLNIFNALARLTPEGFIRRRMRQHAKGVDEVIRQNFEGDLRGEIERLWKMMQEAGNTPRGEAFAAALKAFMPRRVDRKKNIESLFKSAGFRERMAKGGESLVRDFFQMMAGPRAQAGPLAEFDASIQSALSGMLRKVMESKGLVAENQSVQATDIDKLVRSVSADALRFEKIAAADAAMQEELDKIEDPERRAVLQQAWEEATSKMYTNIASEATLRRAVNAELKETPIDWTSLYDKNRGTDAEKRRVVAAVMAKVEALLTDAGDKNVQQNLDMLRSEVAEAFDQVAAIKRAQWLAGREAAESRRRTAERKAAFVEALKVKGISEKALLDLNAKLDLPARPGAERNEVSVLIGDNIKAPVEDFVAKLTALGVDQDTAEALDKVSVRLRAEYAEAARVAAIEALKLVPTKLTRQAIERLNSIMAGPMKPHVKGEVATLISEHSKAIVPDFVERMVALGVDRAAAVDLDNILKTSRVDRFLASLLKVAPERNKTAKEKLSKVIRTVLEAGNLGAMDSQQFMDLFAKEFGLPPMTKEFKAEIKEMVRGINALPKGPARIDAIQALEEKLALWEGIKTRDVLMSTWYANILSGVSTQAVGLLYNNLNLLLKSAVTMLANPKSAKAFVQGALGEGLRTGLKEAAAALRGRGLYKVSKWGDKAVVNGLELLNKQGPIGPAQWAAYIASIGTLTRKVFHLMAAVDALAWNTAREGHAYLAAHRALREELAGTNPTVEDFNRKFVEKLGGDTAQIEADLKEARGQLIAAGATPDLTTIDRMARQMRDDRRAETQGDNRFADRVVVQQEPEGLGRLVSALINAIQQVNIVGAPVGQMLVPFNKIVSNLFEQSLDYTPVGIVRGALGGHLTDVVQFNKDGIKFREGSKMFDSTERWERAITGTLATSIGFALYALAASMKDEDDEDVPFMIYAFGPTDKNKRSQMPKGWAPFTIKIGDVYYKFAEAPFGMMFAGIGSALDAIRYEKMDDKTAVDKLTYVMKSAAKGFMTQGVLSSVDTAIDVLMLKASDKKLSDIPISAMKGAIPGQGLLRDLSTLTDDRKIDGSTMKAALLRDIPFVKSYAGNPELNRFGEPVTFDGLPVVRRFGTMVEKNHVADYLGRNDLYIPGIPQIIEVGAYLPKEMKDRLQRRALEISAMENGMFTKEQNYEFKKRAGELTKRAVERIMQANPPITNDVQRKKVQSALNKQIEIARKRAMLEAVPIK